MLKESIINERLHCNKGTVRAGHAANPEGHLATAAASGQALTKNQKKKLKKKLKKAGAGSQTTDSGQQPDASHTDSGGSCGTGTLLLRHCLWQYHKWLVQPSRLTQGGHSVQHAMWDDKTR